MKNLYLIAGWIFMARAATMLYVSYAAPLSENRTAAFRDYMISLGVGCILFKLNDIHDDILKQKK